MQATPLGEIYTESQLNKVVLNEIQLHRVVKFNFRDTKVIIFSRARDSIILIL